MPNAIVIAVDGLRASSLGAYGNTWHPTPALDEMASQSLVLDWMWCTGPELADFYQAAWCGAADGVERSLPALLAERAVHAVLVTDDGAAADLALHFAEVQQLEPAEESSAASVADTQLAALFAAAIDHLQGWSGTDAGPPMPAGRLLWLHARGYRGAWDAPLELREQLLEEGDPPTPTFLAPPRAAVVEDHDELLLYRAAYAAQTMVLDECLAALLAAVSDLPAGAETLLVLVGCRGFALGEHGAVGGDVDALFSELLHVPCLVRRPGGFPPPRSPQLHSPVAINATLCDWFDCPPLGNVAPQSLLHYDLSLRGTEAPRVIVAQGRGGERAIRTPAWLLRLPGAEGPERRAPPELYVKPDDRWEANEVADRCPDVASRLAAWLDQSGDATGQLPVDDPLDDDLVLPAR